MLEIRLLGKFEVRVNGRVVELPLRAAQALLAYLVLNAGTEQRREQVAGLLWPDMPDAKAKDNLRHTLWVIRKALGNREYLLTDDLTVTFNTALDHWLDTALLDRKTTREESAADLIAAVSVYGGGLLPGFYDDWIVLERERLQAVFERKMALLLDKLVEAQRWPEVLDWGERWIALGHVPELAYRALMAAHAGLGDMASVATMYQRCIDALHNELGVEPAAQTRALYERLQHEARKDSTAITVDVKVARYHLPAHSSRFIGRERELTEAQRLWQQTLRGEGHVLLISGEPGVGKTRLARELLSHAQAGGAIVLLGECFAEGAAPYAPLAEVIAATDLSGVSPSIVADLLIIAPALRATYPDVTPNLLLEPQAERQRIFDNVAAFFALLSKSTPIVLFIDDLHWADSGSLFLLHHLARRVRSLRVLIVLTYREVELSEARPFHEMLLDFNRERLATRVKLHRFDRDHTHDLLAALFQEEITPEFLDGIYGETDGNPFFVEEVCKALIESGKVYREGGQWQRPDMDQIEIPQSVRVAIELRVAKLPAPTQEALRAAAILGREFEFEVLRAMDGLSEDALIEALEIAERAQLIGAIKRSGSISFAFAHALIPLTLHEGLSALRRQRLHRRAAQAIEQVHADRLASGDIAAILGRHYAEAGDLEQALQYTTQAGERARSVYAYQEAIDHYRQVLALLKEQGAAGTTPAVAELTRAARTAMTLGQLYHTVFDFERSQQAYQDGFALWQQVEEEQRKVTLPPAPHALRLLWTIPIRPLDVTSTSGMAPDWINHQLFSGLVECTAELDIVPGLARSWEILDHGRRYVFHLRPDARWSDGRPVTAHDFEFTWKRQLNPANAAPDHAMLFDIKGARACFEGRAQLDDVGVRAIDDLTLDVQLEEPAGYFLDLLAFLAMFAIPRHAVEAHGPQWATPAYLVSNGPFRLETWQPEQSIVLVRNPDYHGRATGNVSRVELIWLDDRSGDKELKSYEAGVGDICVLNVWAPPEVIEQARGQHADEGVEIPEAATQCVWFDLGRPPFDDRRVRQAFVHAVDRVRMVEVVSRGITSPALGGFVPPSLPGHSTGIGLAYDPERARQLLAEAGYPAGRGFPAIEAYFISFPYLPPTAQYLRQQWHDVLGIDLQFRPSFGASIEQLTRLAPYLVLGGWLADYPDPHSFLSYAIHSHVPEWRDANYEHLLDTARRTTDAVARIKIYQSAERILMHEAPVMPLTYSHVYYLRKPWVKQYPMSPLNKEHWKDVIIEPH